MADLLNGLGIELWHVFLLSVVSFVISALNLFHARAEKAKKQLEKGGAG